MVSPFKGSIGGPLKGPIGLKVQGLGFKVKVYGFRVQGLGFRVLGFRVLGFQGLGSNGQVVLTKHKSFNHLQSSDGEP